MRDDTSVILALRDGLVILTGCSDAGICNIVKHAVELTGIRKIKAIIGGFHLLKASEERIKKTIECLAQHDIDLIAVGRCTEFKAQVELYLKFKDKFTPFHTGISFTF